MRCFILFLPSLLFGATATIKRIEANATQAVVWYIAPADADCNGSVREGSESTVAAALLLPIAITTDPSLFTGADSDNPAARTWTLRMENPRERKFIVGSKNYPLALDNTYKSGALPADTAHTALITCPTGASPDATNTALKVFRTMKYPTGVTTRTPWPYDSTQLYNVGDPTFSLGLGDGVTRPKQVHHITGASMWPFIAPGSFRMSDSASLCSSFPGYCRPFLAYAATGWTNLGGITSGTGTATTHTGGGTEKLFLSTFGFSHDGESWGGSAKFAIEDIQVQLKAQASGTGSVLNVCQTFSGFSGVCATDTKTSAIPTSQAFVNLPSTYPLPFFRSWQGGTFVNGFHSLELFPSDGTATTSNNHDFVVSGLHSYLRDNTPVGSKVWIDGSGCNGASGTAALNQIGQTRSTADICTISAITDEFHFSVTESSANVTAAAFTQQASGFLVWITGTTNTVTLADMVEVYQTSSPAAVLDDGNSHIFSPETVTDDITGATAYMVNIRDGSGGQALYIWVPATHELRFLDKLWPTVHGSGGSDNSGNNNCNSVSSTFIRGSDGKQGVCLIVASNGDKKLMRWTYDAATYGFPSHTAKVGYGDDNPALTWADVGTANIISQTIALDARFSPTFFGNVQMIGTQGNYAIVLAQHGQDKSGAFITVAVSTGVVTNVFFSMDVGQAIHTMYAVGGETYVYWNGGCCGQNGSETYGSALTKVNGVSGGQLTSTPAINCPANLPSNAATFGIATGQQKCDQITVLGQPCMPLPTDPNSGLPDSSYQTLTGTCGWDGAKAAHWKPWTKGQFLQDPAALGDASTYGEIMIIVDTPVVGADITFTIARGGYAPSITQDASNTNCTGPNPKTHDVGFTIVQGNDQGCIGAMYQFWDFSNNTNQPFLFQTNGHSTIKWNRTAADTNVSYMHIAYIFNLYGIISQSGNNLTAAQKLIPDTWTSHIPAFSTQSLFSSIQSHCSSTAYNDPRLICWDMTPLAGSGGNSLNYTFTQATTAITGVWKVTGLSPGPNRYISIEPTVGAYMGREISGPSADMATSNENDFCVIYISGDSCGSGLSNTVNDVYVKVSRASAATNGQCQTTSFMSLCPTWNSPTMAWATAWDLTQNEGQGLRQQRIANVPRQFQGVFDNTRADPTGNYALIWRAYASGLTGWFVVTVPNPFAANDGINRSDWYRPAIGFQTTVSGATRASIAFGAMSYMASPSALQCTPRVEACSTGVNGAVDDFSWASETQTYPLISAGPLRPAFPPQEVILYKRQYRAADGSLVSEGPLDVLVTP